MVKELFRLCQFLEFSLYSNYTLLLIFSQLSPGG